MAESSLQTVGTFLDEHQIADGCILVAVSGGADSLALLSLLHQLAATRRLTLHVGHFDHQLRANSAADAKAVQHYTAELGWSCSIGTREQLLAVRSPSVGIEVTLSRPDRSEEQARALRYAYLQQLAEEVGARWLAVAHSADDQTETVLHHIVRGTGLKGLAGMPETRPLTATVQLIRPLLAVRREVLRAELATFNWRACEDETNLDRRYTRNRLRNELLPLLRADYNPQVDTALLRLATHASEAQQALQELAAEWLAAHLKLPSAGNPESTIKEAVLKLPLSALATLPRGLIKVVLMQLWKRGGWPRQSMNEGHWNRLLEMVLAQQHDEHHCPGGVVVKIRRRVLEVHTIMKDLSADDSTERAVL